MPADAILQDRDGRSVLRFERLLRHPPERVWTALTQTEDLRHWHPSPFELEPRPGGAVRFLPPDGAAFGTGEVTDYDPPRLLAYTWGDDRLRWELHDDAAGCLLVLEHVFEDRFKSARDAAGWHICLDSLAAALDGTPRRPDNSGWEELNGAYEQRFGIPHEKATPPPT